jgi:hypothetical protein
MHLSQMPICWCGILQPHNDVARRFLTESFIGGISLIISVGTEPACQCCAAAQGLLISPYALGQSAPAVTHIFSNHTHAHTLSNATSTKSEPPCCAVIWDHCIPELGQSRKNTTVC